MKTLMNNDAFRSRLKYLRLYGLASEPDETLEEPWVSRLVELEERERQRRSLERRVRNAKLRSFNPLEGFDWTWPTQIDRQGIEELFTLDFIDEGANVIIFGPNGVGKTMIAKNLGHHALIQGHTVLSTTASEMLNDLAAQDGRVALHRRLRRYCHPRLLVTDEIGYLAYDARHADLLFEVVSRRYEEKKPMVITTNRVFQDWPEVFPNATSVVTLIDRLVHRSESINIVGESYRLKEARERNERKKPRRAGKGGQES